MIRKNHRVVGLVLMTTTVTAVAATAALPPPPPSAPAAPAAPAASAASSSPATQPAKTTASAQELFDQAIQAMRARQLDAAAALMDKAYDATPPAQRTRPLVLNRGIVDLTLRLNVMRAVRELSQYLREHPEPDEQAQNILGAALNVAADTPRWKQGALWQSAYREWERRNDLMTATRPGFHRWGPYWLDNAQYEKLQSEMTDTQAAIDAQAARVTQAANHVDEMSAQSQSLAQSIQTMRDQVAGAAQDRQQLQQQQTQQQQYEQQLQRWQQYQQQQQLKKQPPPGSKTPAGGGVVTPPTPPSAPQPPLQPPILINTGNGTGFGGTGNGTGTGIGIGNNNGGLFPNGTSIYQEQGRINGELAIARRDLRAEQSRLAELKARSAVMGRPMWPRTFEPIDPSALTPPAPLPPDPAEMAAIMQTVTKAQARVDSPFSQSGIATKTPLVQAPAPGGPGASAPPGAPVMPAPPATPGGPAAAQPAPPTTAPSLEVPFGPRDVDKHPR